MRRRTIGNNEIDNLERRARRKKTAATQYFLADAFARYLSHCSNVARKKKLLSVSLRALTHATASEFIGWIAKINARTKATVRAMFQRCSRKYTMTALPQWKIGRASCRERV